MESLLSKDHELQTNINDFLTKEKLSLNEKSIEMEDVINK